MTLNQALLGSAVIKIDSIDPKALCNKLLDSCKAISLSTAGESITVKIYYTDLKKVISLLEHESCIYKVENCCGILYKLSKYSKRYGIFIGVLLSVIVIVYMSNIAMSIQINCEYAYESLIDDVLSVLKDLGVYPGAFLPSINCLKIEAEIFEVFDDISWVSVGCEGSKVIVNMTLAPQKSEYQTKRIPSNIVASRDGVIVDAKVLAGELSVLIGDAVSEDELLVSGIVERQNGTAYYYHSIGEIIAEFDEIYTVRQSYIDKAQVTGSSVYKTHFKLYDYIFGNNKPPYENFTEEEYEQVLTVFGIKLPLCICHYKLTEIKEDIKFYDNDSATEQARKKLDILERELLAQYEIIDSDITVSYDENGVVLTVKYTLRGNIGKQEYIFAD